MRSTVVTCDRCGVDSVGSGMLQLAHDANDDHPTRLAFVACREIDLCGRCAAEFVRWLKPNAAIREAEKGGGS